MFELCIYHVNCVEHTISSTIGPSPPSNMEFKGILFFPFHSLLFFFAQKFDEVVLKDPASHTAQTKKGRRKKTKRLNICSNCKAYRRNVLNNVSDMISLSHSTRRERTFSFRPGLRLSWPISLLLIAFSSLSLFRCCFKYIKHTHTQKSRC